jgi:hypothetical protein
MNPIKNKEISPYSLESPMPSALIGKVIDFADLVLTVSLSQVQSGGAGVGHDISANGILFIW